MGRLRAAGISFASGHPGSYTRGLANHPDVEFIGVAEVPGETARHEMAESFAGELGIKHWDDYVAMLDEARPDVVSLCVVPSRNPEVIVEAARRGIHMISEKPLAATLAEAEWALGAARRAGVVFSLDIPAACFARPFLDISARIAAGAIGEPRVAYSHFLQPKGPRHTFRIQDGLKVPARYGELENFGPYAFLSVAKALGQNLRSVFARRDTFFYEHYRPAGLEDLCLASLTFSGGAVANIVVGRTPTKSIPAADFRLEVIGSQGSALVDDMSGDKFLIWGPYSDGSDPFEGGGVAHQYFSPSPIAAYIDDVVEAIQQGRRPRIDIGDSLEVMRFVEGCLRSSRNGQPVLYA